jgi:hypothetical protein
VRLPARRQRAATLSQAAGLLTQRKLRGLLERVNLTRFCVLFR